MFQRILVPVDGTTGSERAIPYAIALARALEAEIVVCHVLTTPVTPGSAAEEPAAAKYVARIAGRFREEGVATRTLVRRGQAALEINRAATEWNVDAVVMATRSRRRVEKLMLGSVADVVVRDSQLPVLLVSSRRQLKKAVRQVA